MLEKRPTIMQKLTDGHETLLRKSKSDAGPSLGLGTADHLLPFHASISVLLAPPRPLPEPPTAKQSPADTQKMLARALGVELEPGFGLGTIDQLACRLRAGSRAPESSGGRPARDTTG
jgi:hypothetical protein